MNKAIISGMLNHSCGSMRCTCYCQPTGTARSEAMKNSGSNRSAERATKTSRNNKSPSQRATKISVNGKSPRPATPANSKTIKKLSKPRRPSTVASTGRSQSRSVRAKRKSVSIHTSKKKLKLKIKSEPTNSTLNSSIKIGKVPGLRRKKNPFTTSERIPCSSIE